MVFDPQKEKRV